MQRLQSIQDGKFVLWFYTQQSIILSYKINHEFFLSCYTR